MEDGKTEKELSLIRQRSTGRIHPRLRLKPELHTERHLFCINYKVKPILAEIVCINV